MKKILTFMLFISLFSLFGCSKNKGFTKTIYVFDTTVTINLYEGEESNLDDIIDILNYYHKLTDAYHTYDGITNVKKVNDKIKSGQTDLVISKDLASVLDIPIGIVNILGSFLQIDKSIMLGIGDLTNLWKEAISKIQLPNEDIINQIVQDIKDGKYNYTVSVNQNDGLLKVDENSKVQFDLGAITKGYVSTIIHNYLVENNIKKYMIDLGQSTILVGEKENGKGFNILVNGTNYVLKDVKNSFIGTASILEQKTIINGKTYHHIIDPTTGYPTDTYDTVVVVTPMLNYDKTDLLSTFLMINPDAASFFDGANLDNPYHIHFFKDGKLVGGVMTL